jgi:hypothetical protein
LSGAKISFCSGGKLFTIFRALAEVQITSVMVFSSAVQLIYEITLWSGYCALNLANSSAGAESANEQPAFISGRITFLPGLMILAVSAMK